MDDWSILFYRYKRNKTSASENEKGLLQKNGDKEMLLSLTLVLVNNQVDVTAS